MIMSENSQWQDACYLALKARDARFDGRFFTGVTSTGIYCRPCSAKVPSRRWRRRSLATGCNWAPVPMCPLTIQRAIATVRQMY